MGRFAFLILAVGLAALAGCGKRERVTTVTTVRTVTPAPIAPLTAGGVEAASASGFAPEGASGTTSGNQPSAGGGVAGQTTAQTGVQTVPEVRKNTLPVRGAMMMAGVGSALVVEGIATSAGATAPAAGSLLAGASGAQCANPFDGPAAAGGQSICGDTGEKLACQCSDGSCQLFHTLIMACGPTGTVVN